MDTVRSLHPASGDGPGNRMWDLHLRDVWVTWQEHLHYLQIAEGTGAHSAPEHPGLPQKGGAQGWNPHSWDGMCVQPSLLGGQM